MWYTFLETKKKKKKKVGHQEQPGYTAGKNSTHKAKTFSVNGI